MNSYLYFFSPFIFIFSFIFNLSSCTTSSSSKINSLKDHPSYPFIVRSVSFGSSDLNDTDSKECSSIIVSSNTLLTAAHCVFLPSLGKRYQTVRVKFSNQVFESEKISWHPLFEKKFPYFYSSETGEIEEKEIDSNSNDYYRYDIAVVVFDEKPFRSIQYPKVFPPPLSSNTHLNLLEVASSNELDLKDSDWNKTNIEKVAISNPRFCPKGTIEIRIPNNLSGHNYISSSIERGYGTSVLIHGNQSIAGILAGPGEYSGSSTDEITCFSSFSLKENTNFLKSTFKKFKSTATDFFSF